MTENEVEIQEAEQPTVVEGEGRTADEAVRRLLMATAWSRSECEIEVLDPGSRSLFGEPRPARVRISRGSQDVTQLTGDVTRGVLEHMGLHCQIDVSVNEDHIAVTVEGDEDERLLENDGEGLDALQHLVSRIVSRRSGERQMVQIDSGGFRQRRERDLRDLAYRMADEVRGTGDSQTTDEFGAADRRVIHLALNEDPDITTYALGEGLVKRIVIAPIDQAPPPESRTSSSRDRGRSRGGRGRDDSRGRGRDRDRSRGRDRDRGPRREEEPREAVRVEERDVERDVERDADRDRGRGRSRGGDRDRGRGRGDRGERGSVSGRARRGASSAWWL